MFRCVTLLLLVLALALGNNAFGQPPRVVSVTPDHLFPGGEVSINGFNLNGVNSVKFGSVEGNIISVTDQLIKAEIPSGSTVDMIKVLNKATGRSAFSPLPYTMSFGGAPGLVASDFEAPILFPSGAGLADLCMCDLDRDGLNDIVTANSDINEAIVFHNKSTVGNINFTSSKILLGANSQNLTCGDLTGDGKPEIVITEAGNGSRIFVVTNNSTPGSIVLSAPMSINIPEVSTKRVEIHDMDFDGRPDLTITDLSSPVTMTFIKNLSTGGTLTLGATPRLVEIAGAGSSAGLEIVDLNGDRKPDVITTEFVNTGSGFNIGFNKSTASDFGFTFQNFEWSGATAINVKAADLNDDNKPDLIFTDFFNGEIAIFLNETSGGTTKFSDPIEIQSTKRIWELDIADFDGDGLKDFVVTSLGTPFIGVIRNTTTGSSLSFDDLFLTVPQVNKNLKAGDLDGDAKPDIAITGEEGDLMIIRNAKCIIPIIKPSEDVNLCSDITYELTTQSVRGAIYEWKIDGNIEKSGPDAFIDVAVGGEYSVVIREGSCVNESNVVNISIGSPGSLPSPNITSPTAPICIGGTLTLAMQDVGADSFVWRFPDGSSQNTMTPSITVTNDFGIDDVGDYDVEIYSGTCLAEIKTITVEAVPTPNFAIATTSPSFSVCVGTPIVLNIDPMAPGFTYEWLQNGSPVATGTSFSPSSSGSYTVKASASGGCPPILTDAVDINILTPPVADFDGPSLGCVDGPLEFKDQSTADPNATVDYRWTFGDGNVSSEPDPTHIYSAAAEYNVTLITAYNGVVGCSDTHNVSLKIDPPLTVEILAEPQNICEGSESELSTSIDYISYNWNTGEETRTIKVSSPNVYSVLVTDASGCTGFDDIELSTFPPAFVEISADITSTAPGQPVQLMITGLEEVEWSPAEFLDDPTSTNPIATISNSTEFIVIGTDANGCTIEQSILIRTSGDLIGELIKPKNFFSPNKEDDINSTWVIDRIEEFEQCTVKVYDQTGNILYESQPYLNDWDGTSKGRDVPEGVYYFTIVCGQNEIVKSGSITLLR